MKQTRLVVALSVLLLGWAGFSWAQDQATPYYNAGNNFYSQQNYDQAIRYYQYATQLNPNLWQAYQGLGNCYYAKGDKTTALTDYQKALAINPNNAQLSSFAQSLQAQAGSAPQSANNGPVAQTSSPAATPGSPKFELDVLAGGAFVLGGESPAGNAEGVTVGLGGGYGIGLGGGVGAYFPLIPDLSIGANIAYYTYGATYTYEYPSGYGISGGITESASSSNLEIVAAAKYHLQGNPNLKPYLLGGLGMANVTSSGSVTEVLTGLVNENEGEKLPSISSFCPMVQIGGGVEIPAGKDMNFFAEGKFNFIFVGSATQSVTVDGVTGNSTYAGYTFIEFPINVGLDFNL